MHILIVLILWVKLKNGEYKLEEILNTGGNSRELGEYKGSKIILKNGRYGSYVEYNEKKYSIKFLIILVQIFFNFYRII